jgi:hypothetical protein
MRLRVVVATRTAFAACVTALHFSKRSESHEPFRAEDSAEPAPEATESGQSRAGVRKCFRA